MSSIIKLGEAINVLSSDVHSTEEILNDPSVMAKMADDSEILAEFKKTADALKRLAPKAKDFLYFSAIMMHAAEASLVENDGSLKKDASGKDIHSEWDKSNNSWKWVCSDKDVLPYKNSNNDIFPEEELIKAHKKWVGRPLCIDHKSSSVDFIRGVIVDTFYDRKHKRVIALCALDKINYDDLARKVATGYATSVSMGTAVGRAICTDCGRVARVESDFCPHMKTKSGYGEINVDLNPIELSIVVNGADPKAKIRHIVAAADSIAQYLGVRAGQLASLASDETRDIELCEEISKGLSDLILQASDLKKKVEQLKGNEEAEQDQHESTPVEEAPVVEAAKEDAMLKNASANLDAILKQVEQLNSKFDKLSTSEETKMTDKRAYFQGAGGVNEPTPGKPKYEKEEADSIRNTKDKHMESVVDTGPVDGMFPGDEQKKRELLRLAELEKREQKRLAAVASAKQTLDKSGYYQGAGGVNEPTPGKVKYPKEEADKIRDKEDTHMYAPGTGKVDGLFDKDLEAKKKLLRAKLNAKFIKAARPDGTHDQGESRWQVFADNNEILTATVNEITGNRAEALYESVANKQFGLGLLNRIKSEGFDKVKAMYKGAQTAPPVSADPMAAAMPDMPAGPEVADEGKAGDPKEQLDTVAKEISNLSAQLLEVSDALSGKTDDLGSFEELAAEPSIATAKTLNLLDMRSKLSEALVDGVKVQLDELRESADEVKLARILLNDVNFSKRSKADREDAKAMINDTCRDALNTIAEGKMLLGSFVKYARATTSVNKRAKGELAMKKTAQEMVMPADKVTTQNAKQLAAPFSDAMKEVVGPGEALNPAWEEAVNGPAKPPLRELRGPGNSGSVRELNERQVKQMPLATPVSSDVPAAAPVEPAQKPHILNQIRDTLKADDGEKDKDEKDEPKDENDLKAGADGSMEGTPEEVGKALKEKSAESRAERRAKLAQKAVQWSDMLQKAHGGGGTTTQLDVKPTGDLAKVETLPEVHQKMHDLANAPPKVRKQAEDIQKCIVAGLINPATDFDGLVAEGLDSQAVAYWKKFYSQAPDGGSQFASELVKEQAKAKVAEEQSAYRAKVTRAYELAHDMANAGLIAKEASSINAQVDSILQFNEASFENLKRIVANRGVIKQAASLPNVGMIGAGEIILPAPEAAPSDYSVLFENYFAGKKF